MQYQKITRRNALTGAGAAVGALAITGPALAGEPKKGPISPVEYLAEMKAIGWYVVVATHRGEPSGLFEHATHDVYTVEDMLPFWRIQKRCGKSGRDFYRRVARYLFDRGHSTWPVT